MAFKQKSGSPFLRNFGVGKSPVKQTSPMKDTGEEKYRLNRKEGPPHNPVRYKPKDWEIKNAINHNMEHQNNPDWDENHENPGEESALEMKSSGFKMKSSPFNRNFGVGEAPSPMKKLGKYIDGELVDDATYKDFVMKNKELNIASEGVGGGGGTDEEQSTLKEHFGDDFMTEKEFVLKNNPNLYYEDGGFYEKGTHSHVQSDFGYNEYFDKKGDEYTSAKQTEQNIHKYGTSDHDEIDELDTASNYGAQSGVTEASRVTLTGQDLLQDYERQWQIYKKQNPKMVGKVSKSDWLEDNDLTDTYKEAESFVRSGEEDPQTLNREDLTDQ